MADGENPLDHPRYPRASGYDPSWVIENQMGPNALWLLESLLEVLSLAPGSKVLDLGCGKAMTSILLAKELGVRVWATDLWIPAAENQRRVVDAGVSDLVTPIHAEAHALPFADGFFDAIVSIDAYQYFGTDDLYIGYLVNFLGEQGRLGAVMPAMLMEFGAHVPESLRPYWEWEFCSLHGPEWWRTHWEKTGKVAVDHADAIEDGWKDWQRFNAITMPFLDGWRAKAAADTAGMLEADRGEYIGFTRITATKRRQPEAR